MKYAFFVAFLALAQSAAMAADTAYSALRIMAKQRGDSALNQVLEVRGRQGKPQPDVWRITLKDDTARGGLREVEVQKGQIISQRTPVARPIGGSVNLNQLNLDSDGVFMLVNQETDKAGVVFDRIDFVLRSGTRGGAPVWTTELFNRDSGRVGLLEISADSGAILRKELEQVPARELTQNDRKYLEEDSGPPPPPENRRYTEERRYSEGRYPEEREVRERRPVEAIDRFFGRVERHFKRRGRQVENFFTGRDGEESPRDR